MATESQAPIDAISELTPFDLEATLRQIRFFHRGVLPTVSGMVFKP